MNKTGKSNKAAQKPRQRGEAKAGAPFGSAEPSKAPRDTLREERRAAAAKQMAGGVPRNALLPIEPHVTILLSGSKATVYRRAKTDPTFPKLIRLSSRCTRIRAGDLFDWLNSQGEA